MQKFKCHKEVEAAKIVGFELDSETMGGVLRLADGGHWGAPKAWLDKQAPGWGTIHADVELVGGYLVLYADGYMSWSPAEAFEQGYTELKDGEAQGLPVAGYKPTQPAWAIEAVNGFKELEERTLRAIDDLGMSGQAIDARFLAVGKTQLQQAFMAINRAVFQPGRVTLPEDPEDFFKRANTLFENDAKGG